jgi:seryl-tRNA synthetase
MKHFLGTLKELSLEFKALLDIKASLRTMIKLAEDNRRKQTEINKEISKARLTEGDQVKTSMFGGKVNKEERIKDLNDQLKEVDWCY